MTGLSHRIARILILAIGIIVTGMELPCLYAASTSLSPEVDLYFTHNNIFRSRIIAASDWSKTSSNWTTGFFEYSVDFGMMSFFRRYVYKDPNSEKGKFISFRVGYVYLADYQSADSGDDEQRGNMEATLRFPIGGQILISDTNKGDFRWIDDVYSTRYRNRLKLERGMRISRFRATPYTSVEGFYDMAIERWSLVDARAGVEIPWKYSSVLEFYYARKAFRDKSPDNVIGFAFQKHMAMPIGQGQ